MSQSASQPQAAEEVSLFEFIPRHSNHQCGRATLRLSVAVDEEDAEPVTVGRTPDNRIPIVHSTVSSRHCVITFEFRDIAGSALREPVCRLKDESTNGIFVEGQPVGRGQSVLLADGDLVKLAKNQLCRLEYLLKVRLAASVAAALAAARAAVPRALPAAAAPAAAHAPVVREGDVHEFYDFIEGEKPDPGPDFLGDGGFSMVYKAIRRSTGELVAIKRVDLVTTAESAASSNTSLNPLEVEVAILSRLRHPNIVRLHEVIRPAPPPPARAAAAAAEDPTPARGPGAGSAGARGGWRAAMPPPPPSVELPGPRYMYIVTELVTGGELFYRVADKPTPEPRARGLFRQLCRAVAYLHEQGLVHRDLKPENILLQPYLVADEHEGGEAEGKADDAADDGGAGGAGAGGAGAGSSAAAAAAPRPLRGTKKYKVLVTDFGMASIAEAAGPGALKHSPFASGPAAASAASTPAAAAAAAASTPGEAALDVTAAGSTKSAASDPAASAAAAVATPSAASPQATLVAPSAAMASVSSRGSGSSGSAGDASSGGAAAGGAGAGAGAGAVSPSHRMHTQVGTKMYLAPEAAARYESSDTLSLAENCERFLHKLARHSGIRHWGRIPGNQLVAPAGAPPLSGPGTTVGLPPGAHYRPGPDDYAAHAAERLMGYTAAVDSYALGVVLYMVLSSSMPFWLPEPGAAAAGGGAELRPPMLVQMMTCFMPLEGDVWDHISQPCKDLVKRLLHPNPNKRITPAQALAHPWLARTPEEEAARRGARAGVAAVAGGARGGAGGAATGAAGADLGDGASGAASPASLVSAGAVSPANAHAADAGVDSDVPLTGRKRRVPDTVSAAAAAGAGRHGGGDESDAELEDGAAATTGQRGRAAAAAEPQGRAATGSKGRGGAPASKRRHADADDSE